MKFKIVKLNIRENDSATAKHSRIYVWTGNVVVENLFGGKKPYTEYRKELLPLVFEKLKTENPDVHNAVINNKWSWKDKCGCSCGCSPGFVGNINTDSPTDIHVTIKISNNV